MKTLHIVGLFAICMIVALIVIVLLLFSNFRVVWDSCNSNLQAVDGGKSRYSGSVNVCSEKIKGVWEANNQYMDHESKTFQGVAEARSGYQAAAQAFEEALKSGQDTKALTQAGEGVVQAALAFRIQIEAYPQLRAVEATKENMRNMQEATNEIKTALDDWINSIQSYNNYRGSFWPNFYGMFMSRFPAKIEYYEGERQKLDMDSLNPAKK